MTSIVLRTYNRADLLPRAIDSALAQDWPNKEVIIVDDGSTDNTREVAAQFPQVRYVYQENQGVQGARLTGFRNSTGTYLAYLDSDDVWVPHFLSSSIAALEAHDAGFTFCDHHRLNLMTGESMTSSPENVPSLLKIIQSGNHDPHPLPPAEARALFVHYLPAPTSSYVLRRELCDDHREGRVFVMDDLFAILRMIFAHKVAGVFMPERMMTKSCYPSSICEGDRGRHWELQWHANDFGVLLKNFGKFMTPAERAPWLSEVAEHNFTLGHLASQQKNLPLALHHYRLSFQAQPSLKTAFAMLKSPARVVLPRAVAP